MARSPEFTERTEHRGGRPPGSAAGASPAARKGVARAIRPAASSDDNAVAESERGGGDWQRVALFGAGIAIGLALGAGTALVLAPRSGEETREILAEAFSGRWDTLRDDLRWRSRLARRKADRAMTRGRWSAEDVRDRLARRLGRARRVPHARCEERRRSW